MALHCQGARKSNLPPPPKRVGRQQCIDLVIEGWGNMEIDDDVKARLDEARQYYYDKLVNPSTYKVPNLSKGCKHLHKEMTSVMLKNTCFSDTTVMGPTKTEYQNVLDVLKLSADVRLRFEAEYACQGGHLAGKLMRDLGIFSAIVKA